MKEITVAKKDDLQNGQMKQIAVGDSQLLLSSRTSDYGSRRSQQRSRDCRYL